MRKYPSRHEYAPAGVSMPTAPGTAPMAMAPTPMAPMAAPAPSPFPMVAPTQVAPVRRVVHPTRYMERHTVTKYPIENIYPSHTHNVHHKVYEYHCCYPHTESHQVCKEVVDHCSRPPRRRPY